MPFRADGTFVPGDTGNPRRTSRPGPAVGGGLLSASQRATGQDTDRADRPSTDADFEAADGDRRDDGLRTPGAPRAVTPPPADAVAAPFDPKDTSVTGQLNQVLGTNSPLLEAARTRAKQDANRRGLLNSTMAVQAGERATLDVALPIASQQASQASQAELTRLGISSNESIALLNQAAFDREKSTAAVAAVNASYGEVFRTIAANENLPAATRDQYLTHLGVIRDSNLNLIEQLYNIDLTWATTAAPATA